MRSSVNKWVVLFLALFLLIVTGCLPFHEQYAKVREQIEALGSEHEKLAQLCET